MSLAVISINMGRGRVVKGVPVPNDLERSLLSRFERHAVPFPDSTFSPVLVQESFPVLQSFNDR